MMLVDDGGVASCRSSRSWTAHYSVIGSRWLSAGHGVVAVDDDLLARHGASKAQRAEALFTMVVTGTDPVEARANALRRWHYLAEDLGLQSAEVRIDVEVLGR